MVSKTLQKFKIIIPLLSGLGSQTKPPEYDGSYYGDLLVDFFDQYNNMINPISDTGYFLYNLFGKAFDDAMETIDQNLINTDPTTCQPEFLNIIADEWKLKRKAGWSDSKWRAAVIYYYYNFETIKGIEFVLNLLTSHHNKNNPIERDEVVVEYKKGLSDVFLCSDKWDVHDLCSDKTTIMDIIGTTSTERITIDYGNNSTNETIEQLLLIIMNGGIN